MSKKELIRVVIVRPMEEPVVDYIQNELENLQRIVCGYIEVIQEGENNAILICNECGKVYNLAPNRALKVRGYISDVICGDFIIAGNKDGDFISLTEEQCEMYVEKYSLSNC